VPLLRFDLLKCPLPSGVLETKQVGLTPLSVSHLGFIVYPAFCLVKWLNRWRRTAPETGEKLVQEQAS
jgi:hypothetical protein